MVSIVRTRLLEEDPVADSVWTFLQEKKIIKILKCLQPHHILSIKYLIVEALIVSPCDIRLYACHMSSGFSGMRETRLDGQKIQIPG